MQLRNLLDDDSAVSPVIGVILMVAITVILAAVIATFVLGLGEQVSETAPQASFTFDYEEGASACSEDGALTITHSGGATMDADRLTISGASGSVDTAWTSEVSAGDSSVVCIDSDDSIGVNWVSQTGQDSSTLRRWSGPDA